MGKASRHKGTNEGAQALTGPAQPRGVPWFAVTLVTIGLSGAGLVGLLATQRTSVLGIAPEAGKDHWHSAFAVAACGEALPATQDPQHGDGIHAHADGLIHIHPTSSQAAGPNATLGNYLSTVGANLTDGRYEPGPGEVSNVLDVTEGCDGEPAVLQLAVWPKGKFDSDPTIVTSNLADYRFEEDGQAITLALAPAGSEIPISPVADNVNNPGDQ